ncbi:alpha/beta hydrolase [Kordia zhangzhouensis]|uniref:alpha/beta hydrolase n=1 Tax=Kordia zhangzhouensis TaxID=1620405 RepID=UPI0021CE65A4
MRLMKQSITYYITLWVIKLKGIKKKFSKDPINYKKVRKEDVPVPKGAFFKKHQLRTFTVLKTKVTEITASEHSTHLLIFIHGGAFISGPAQHHWDTAAYIAKHTQHTLWMVNYPKAPENQIKEISNNIDAVYTEALTKYSANHICIIGDSVGGTLTAALVQRLVLNNIKSPKKIILVSPVMDASMSNPAIELLEKKDPMLSKAGVLSAKKMCAGTIDLKAPILSPLYGSFTKFPHTFLFLAQNDITYPDAKHAALKMKEAAISVEVIEGAHMPHIWPFLPVMKEARNSLNQIIQILNTH